MRKLITKICLKCGKEFETRDHNKKFCDIICYGLSQRKNLKKICIICKKEFEGRNSCCSEECSRIRKTQIGKIRQEKSKLKLLEKYGVDHPSKIPGHKEKVKKTKLERYGNENYVNREKAEKTNLEKYNNIAGIAYGSKNFKKLMKEKYNDENYNNREQFKQTMIKNYGSTTSQKMKDNIKNMHENGIIGFESQKYKNTIKRKYNVENVSQIEEIKIKKQQKLQKFFLERILKRVEDKVIPLFDLNDYTVSRKIDSNGILRNIFYKFKCKQCGEEFENSIANGRIPRCLKCNPIKFSYTSKYQNEIIEYLRLLNISNIINNDREQIKPKELDIFLPDYNLAIEFDGLYWHSEINGKHKNDYHLEKTKLCEEKNIHLIHIFEDEWINKQNIIKSKLFNLLIKNNKVLYAKNCIIKEINSKDKNIFLEKYHIQGNDKAKYSFGAYYNNELVAVMTFGNYRIALGSKKVENEYELSRFGSSKKIIGISSKLLQYFIKNYKPNKIISYADRRFTHSINNIYEKIGFKKVSNGRPNYWYLDNNYNRFHRFNFRKSELSKKLQSFDSNLTEWQNMQLNGYDRIWDCGNLKYELIIK